MLYTHKTLEYEFPLKDADVALLGIPFTSTETGLSVKHGPFFIREAIKNLPGFDPETGRNPFEDHKICDLGDVSVIPGSWKLTQQVIADTIKEMLEENKDIFPIFMGGEHLASLGILRALAEKYDKITVIDFDAHRDLLKDWMGEPFSHITWAYHAVKELGINLVQLGCRSWAEGEWEPFRERVKETMDGIGGPVYLTIDLDVLDPSVAPEVGTPEPNGMSQAEFFGLLKKVCRHKLIGMDVVECASRQVGTRTALIAANIIKKVIVWRQ